MKALGRHACCPGSSTVRVLISGVIAVVLQIPFGYQVKRANNSLTLGIIGAIGNHPYSWYSIDTEARAVPGYESVKGAAFKLRTVRKRVIAELEATVSLCNLGKKNPTRLVSELDQIGEVRLDTYNWAQGVLSSAGEEEGLLRWSGRRVADVIGLVLVFSHLWMIGGLARLAGEELFGNAIAGWATAGIVTVFGLGIVTETIGRAPRNFYDGFLDWWNGERPLFRRYTRARMVLLIVAAVESAFAIGTALDGAEQTTSGIAKKIQKPVVSMSVFCLAWWGWNHVISTLMHFLALRSKDEDTRNLKEIADRFERMKEAVEKISPEKFAEFLLDLPQYVRQRLLSKTKLNDEALEAIAGLEQILLEEV